MDADTTTSRRGFLKGSAGALAGLTLAFHWSGPGGRFALAAATPAPGALAPNAFVRIGADDIVTVISKHLEMGQGVYTGLATILAEELDADWTQIRIETAPADATLYANLAMGKIQGTGGSNAIRNSWEQLRRAGATARAMLVSAAAERWQVAATEISVANGLLNHTATNRKLRFGEVAEAAARLPVPAGVTLKTPDSFRLIGTRVPRLDSRAKSTGTAVFGIDFALPGLLTAVVARAPRFGATVKSVDETAARAVPGVLAVYQIPSGVAVVARGFWPAKQGRDALIIEWDESAAEMRGSESLLAEYRTLAAGPGKPARRDGDADEALAGAVKTITAEYSFPYLAHAPMEPLDCIVRIEPGACEIWTGCQFQTVDQQNAAAAADLKPGQVRINTLMAGGSFGRRANAVSDYIVEAVHVAKAVGGGTPVRTLWTREDDIQGGRYRPAYLHALTAGLDEVGRLVGWRHRIVGQSIVKGTPFEGFMVKNGIDHTSVEGAASLPYEIPNLSVELHTTDVGVPVLWWRSVGSTHTAFATEAFLDEVAAAAGVDPYRFRRSLLKHNSRQLAVLDLAAEKAGWGIPMPPGRGRGIAVHESFHSVVAEVAEVTVAPDGRITVDRVVCVVDCGTAVNPDVITAQMEGGIGFGLGAALHGAITLRNGEVEQSNFHDYQVLRIDEMPAVEVHIMPSSAPPTGVGEPGVPPIGPAVANAVFAACGKRLRSLPLVKSA